MSLISFKLKSVLLASERERERERGPDFKKILISFFSPFRKLTRSKKKISAIVGSDFFFRRDDFRISRQKSKPS